MKVRILLFLFFATNSILFGQSFNLKLNYYEGIYSNQLKLFKGGSEISLNYQFSDKKTNFSSGAIFRTTIWGLQSGISLGVNQTLSNNFVLEYNIGNSLLFFKPIPIFAPFTNANLVYNLRLKNNRVVGVNLGIRYTIAPSFKKFSSIYQTIEIPIGLTFFF